MVSPTDSRGIRLGVLVEIAAAMLSLRRLGPARLAARLVAPIPDQAQRHRAKVGGGSALRSHHRRWDPTGLVHSRSSASLVTELESSVRR